MDFLPFFVCAGLIAASLAFGVATLAMTIVRRLRERLWPLPLVLTFATLGLLLMTGFCVDALYLQNAAERMVGAAANGNVDEVRAMLDRGASPNACGVDCVDTALCMAARYGHVEVVRLLLARGADVSEQDMHHKTAFDYARENGHEDVLRVLTDAKRTR